MAAEQGKTQAIIQAAIKMSKVAILVAREAHNPAINVKTVYTAPRLGSPVLKLTFYCKTADKYQELCKFESDLKTF